MRPRLTILDDYQNVALTSADWTAVAAEYDIDVVTAHISDVDELVDRLRDSEVIVAMRERTPFPAATLARLPNLGLLVTTGMANAVIDIDAATAQGVTVCGTGGRGHVVAEVTLGMMIALARNFVAEDVSIRAGGWQHTIGSGLAGSTLGLVGLGRLGTQVAALAQAFRMTVIAWSPNLSAERADAVGVRAVSQEELFEQSDYLSIHMVLSDRTRGLIGAADLNRMRPSAYLINTSRGPLVDETALLDALYSGRIAGAALDVFDTEPLPLDHPMRTAPRTLLLPHIGYVTTEVYAVFYGNAVEDITQYRSGNPVRML